MNAQATTPSSKFTNVPVDKDTTILTQQEITINAIHALHQHWVWDGIHAQSIVFATADGPHLDQAQILALIAQSPLVQDTRQITLSQSDDGFAFVDFDFDFATIE